MITQTHRFHLTSLSAISEESLKSLEETSESLCITEQQRDLDHANWNAWINGERQPDKPFEAQQCPCWNRTYGYPHEDWLHHEGECQCECLLCRAVQLEREIRSGLLWEVLEDAVARARQLPWPGHVLDHAPGCDCGRCTYNEATSSAVCWMRVATDQAAKLIEERQKAERRKWLASDEGQAWTAQEEASKQAIRAEREAKERSEAEEFDRFVMTIYERGPLFGIPSSGDQLTDLRALVAAVTASDSRRGYGSTFLYRGQLVELRASPCPLHQDEVLEDQKADPGALPWTYCTASCPVHAEPWQVSTGKRIQALVDRIWASGLSVSEWVRTTWRFELSYQLKYAGHRWKETTGFSHETYQLAAADALWPGVLPLLDIVRQPVLRYDGSVILECGYDALSGLWVQPASAPGQRAIGTSLAGQLLTVAERRGRWFGSMSELAAEISWPRSARALTAALQDPALQRELVSLGVAVYPEGWTSARVRGWVVTKKIISTPDTSELCR